MRITYRDHPEILQLQILRHLFELQFPSQRKFQRRIIEPKIYEKILRRNQARQNILNKCVVFSKK